MKGERGVRYDCLVVSPDGGHLWLASDGGGWSLPHVECDIGWLPAAVAPCRAQLRARYGLEVVVLREIQRVEDASVCAMEALSMEAVAAGAWREARDLDALLSRPEHRAAARLWLEDKGTERLAAPWQRRGWYQQALRWTAAALDRIGLELTEVEQIKGGWNVSALLKVGTSDGAFYFKASPPRLPGESVVLGALCPAWSRHLPPVVDADAERGWTLMRECPGATLNNSNAAGVAQAARLFARLQVDQASHVARWSALRCPDYGLDTMERRLPGLLTDLPGRLHGCGVISEGERNELASFVPQAAALCRRLAAHEVPRLSIHLESFRAGNVLVDPAGELVILDWNETVLAHPFFSIQWFLRFMDRPPNARRYEVLETRRDDTRRAVRDAYLQPFAVFEPERRLREAFQLAGLLAPVYDALRLQAEADLDEIFRSRLSPEESRVARELMDHLLEVRRAVARAQSVPFRWFRSRA